MANLDYFTLIGISSLSIQLTVAVLLGYGYIMKRKLQFRRHGFVMASATLLHLVLIFVIMIPSFVYAVVPNYIVPSPTMIVSLVGLIHGITGSLTVVLAAELVGAWRFKKDFTGCFKRKKFMIPALSAWITTLILGVILFAFFYGPALLA
jgi:hypothetical protein